MKESILQDKSYSFAIRIVKLSRYLQTQKNKFILSKQVLKSGTAIGALVREVHFGQSKADFVSKMSIALKEANETDYWLSLLKHTEFITNKIVLSLQKDCSELLALLVSTVKTSKEEKTFKLLVLTFNFSLNNYGQL